MQKKLAGLTSTLTGGIVISTGEGESSTVSYRQLPTLPTPTDANLTITRKNANELRFTMENVQMPIFMEAACMALHCIVMLALWSNGTDWC